MIHLFFVVFYFFIGNSSDFSKIIPILTFLSSFFILIYKTYQEEKFTRLEFYEKLKLMRYYDVNV